MKSLHIISAIIFCSLLTISADTLADRRHSDRSDHTDRNTGFSSHHNKHYSHNKHQNGYSTKQHWKARKHS
ncbi:MAG: hypothetical protein ACPHPA_03765, partial [Cycloclasticus pugetii]